MNRRTNRVFVTALLLALVAACGTSGKDEPAQQTVKPPAPPAAAPNPPADSPMPPTVGMNENCELALYYKLELARSRLRYDEDHPEVARLRELVESAEANCSGVAANGSPSGQWVERDGQIVCDGYLTRFDDQDYCAAEVPEDWKPFTFDGELYYIQPLDNVESMQFSRGSPRETRKAP